MPSLADLHPGQWFRVERCSGDSDVVRRLIELGLCRGATVYIDKRAPFGGPLLVVVRNAKVALRPAIARHILGTRIQPPAAAAVVA